MRPCQHSGQVSTACCKRAGTAKVAKTRPLPQAVLTIACERTVNVLCCGLRAAGL